MKCRSSKGFTIPEMVIAMGLLVIMTALVYTQLGGIYGINQAAKIKLLLAHLTQVRSEVINMEQNLGSPPLTAAGLIKESEYWGTTEEQVFSVTVTAAPPSSPGSGDTLATTTLQVSLVTIAARQLNMFSFDAHNVITEYLPSSIAPDYLVGSGVNSYFNLDEIMGGKRGYLKTYKQFLFYIVTPFHVNITKDNSAEILETPLGEIIKQCNSINNPAAAQANIYNIGTGILRSELRVEGGCYFYSNNSDSKWPGVAQRYTPPGKSSLVYLVQQNNDYNDEGSTTIRDDPGLDFYGRG